MKPFWLSKLLWVNLIAFVAVVAQEVVGEEVISVESQVGLLAVVNFLLRLVTKDELGW